MEYMSMFIADQWKDFELLDCSRGEKLERWGKYILRRPDPQTIWPKTDEGLWQRAHAWYHRSDRGGGEWEFMTRLPEKWTVELGELQFYVRPTGFKHTGLFPEQSANWEWMAGRIRAAGRKDIRVLNLFAYTGGATMACAAAGAHVTHVDAAKGMVQWAKENRELSGLPETSCRWIVEDVMRFLQRENRRGNRYDGILMDPPSYGRGPGGEVWKLEQNLWPFLTLCMGVLSEDPLFVLINSYTTGLSPSVLSYMTESTVTKKYGGRSDAQELGLPVSVNGLALPCGASCRWTRNPDCL